MPDTQQISARRLRRRRIELGLTQIELAARIGVNNVTVSRWEAGTFRVSRTRLREVAEALDTLPELLLLAPEDAPSVESPRSGSEPESVSRSWLYALLSDLASEGATPRQLDAAHALFLSVEMQRFLDASVDTPVRREPILADLASAARRAFARETPSAATK